MLIIADDEEFDVALMARPTLILLSKSTVNILYMSMGAIQAARPNVHAAQWSFSQSVNLMLASEPRNPVDVSVGRHSRGAGADGREEFPHI